MVPRRTARTAAARELGIEDAGSADSTAAWRRIREITDNPELYPFAIPVAERLDNELDGARPYS